MPATVDKIFKVDPGAVFCCVALLKNGLERSVESFA
jgi:hypothetical protein